MTTVGDTVTARTEAQAAQAAYRTRVRAASLAIVFGLAGVLAVTAILPTTHPVDRGGLLVTAVLVVLAAVLWFGLVPRDAFGPGRIFVAAAIAQGVMVLMLGFTSGVRSPYFPYYLLPVLVMLLSGSPWQSVALGTLSAAGLVGLGIADPVRNDVMRDLAVTRLFELGTMTFFAATTAMATGATRVALAKRTETLAMEREEAFQMAVTDELTGLYNRHYLRDQLRRMSAHAGRRERPFAIISLDVDGLKKLNDTGGHRAGDELLRRIGAALRAMLRDEDVAVRIGGDEFVIVLPDADHAEASKVAYRIRQRVATLAEGAGISSGIAVWRRGTDPEDALREADQDVYRAKAARGAAAG